MGTARGKAVVEGPISRRWSRETGYLTERTFTGIPRSLEALANSLQSTASEWVLRNVGGVGNLTVIYADSQSSGQPDSSDAFWELVVNDNQPSIFDSAAFQSLTEDDQNRVKGAIADFQAGTLNSSPAYDNIPAASAFFDLAKYAETYIDDSWTLRKTQIISYRAELNLSLTGINQLWSVSAIASAEPSLSSIAPGILEALQNVPHPTARDGFLFSLLKRRPNIISRAGNKLEVAQEWVQAQWSTTIYSTYG